MHTTKTLIISILITAVVFSLGTYYMINVERQNFDFSEKNYSSSELQPGLQAAYDRLIKRGETKTAIFGYGFKESKTIGGKIGEIGENNITLKVEPVNALADPELDSRNVIVDKNTKIFKRVEKTEEELANEMEEYDNLVNNQSDAVIDAMPPDAFKNVEITFSDLNQWDNILIEADENIHDKKEFVAEQIIVQ